MSGAISVGAADFLLDELFATAWVQLHTGDPGAAGTGNAATETARQEASFLAAAAGSATTDGDLSWAAVAATETFRYVSVWTAESSGDFIASSPLASAVPVTAGATFTIDAGDLAVTLGAVAA